ncbi:MAG: OmpH family outer membrane protein [Puniceicoccales bacterium]|jgi:outer membrane protein|nr:OmpH family outer membrane protein [Puniceicoccales bacterium]
MKKLILSLCLVASLCGVAQAQKAPKVATIDVETVFNKYQKAVDLKQNLENSAKQADEEIKKAVDKLNALRGEIEKAQKEAENPILNEQGRSAAKAQANAKFQDFQKMGAELQQHRQQVAAALQQRQAENAKRLIEDLRPKIDAIAKEKGADLVLNSTFLTGGVLFADPALDVTDEVVKRLNADYTAAGATTPAP